RRSCQLGRVHPMAVDDDQGEAESVSVLRGLVGPGTGSAEKREFADQHRAPRIAPTPARPAAATPGRRRWWRDSRNRNTSIARHQSVVKDAGAAWPASLYMIEYDVCG